MNRRTERIGKLLQHEIGRVLLEKLADPRIDTARTSITHVEIQEDLLVAKVYVSVIGTEAEQQRCIKALSRASGRIRAIVRDNIILRHTPVLEFLIDHQFKKTLETLDVIRQAMNEIHEKESTKDTN
ncbi:MAG: 30S ribosome-binding factor RbfA [Planctomycetota bacterium]|nr:30S ribosome-binding factor RbfA [Planctomycetota bacterium]